MNAALVRSVAVQQWWSRKQHLLGTSMDRALVRYDAWWLVLVAVILALGATVLIGLAVWCLVTGRGTFTGRFAFARGGVSISVECR
ncbi:hypothetical protein GCM10009846_07510 [Agrococcus versicolor]|uniref:Uncharacterized protein n=2 Tax=Agrococcus versicolor TaxID=501482 RepID=A0ABN3AL61_9MICO